ncbi:MAG TPA: YhdP family protein [Aquabacterium sp.]|nr:YhdP family protein [Aquabacterium sp.]HQC95848.1 YhdP family protein [Aquabacterium sp.]
MGLLLAAWGLVLVAWLSLQWLILPRLDEWRPKAEALAARALGHPVQIGRLATDGGGWLPMFEARDVVLRDAAGQAALRLPRVRAALSVPSLLALRLRFNQLLIEDARLDVRRDAAGRLFVGGLPIGDFGASGAPAAGGGDADWLFQQHEILIRGGTLRWLDDWRQAPPLALSDVQLLLRNSGRRHELRLDATPPADWGERFAIVAQARGALLSHPGDWRRWKGTLHADLPRADVSQLRRHVSLPVDLQQGRAALRAWLDFDAGAPQALTLDAALRGVSVQLARGLEPVALAALDGRLVATRQADAVKLALQNLAFALPDGTAWAPSQLGLQWHSRTPAAGAAAAAASAASEALAWLPPLDGGQLTADRLDLPLLATLAERLPIGAGVRELLRQLDPEGTVSGLDARWEGPLDAPRSWSAKAAVQGLAINAAPSPEPGGIGRPGWRGADLAIDARHDGGSATLTLADGQFTFPGVFAEPVVPLAHFGAQLQWTVAPGATPEALPLVTLKVQNARFDNADTRGALNATWRTGPGTGFGKGARLPGVLQLDGSLAEGRAARVARYLPLGIGPAARLWTQRAVRGGELRDVAFRVQGDLWEFPYVNRRDGDFRIVAQLQGVTLAPVPSVPAGPAGAGEPPWESPWPAITNISGELVFERTSMQFNRTRGTLGTLALEDVSGRIRDLGAEPTLVEVDGTVRGALAEMLRVVRTTPLAEATGHLLDTATASANAELKLALAVPLNRSADTQFKAGLQLPGNELRLRPDLPLLANARGRIESTNKGLAISGLRAQLLGGEAVLDVTSPAEGGLRLVVNGVATADALRRAGELGPVVPRLAQRLQGQATYRLQTSVAPLAQGGRSDWQLASNLQGMAIDLPAPLGKAAEPALPLRLSSAPEVRANGGPAVGPARDALRLDLGALKAALLMDHGAPGGSRLLRSAWSWDAPLPEVTPGGRAVLVLGRVDADAWRNALAPPAVAASSAGAAAAAAADDLAWLPQSLQLQATELLAGGRRLSGVALDLQNLPPTAEAGEGWRGQFKSDQATGSFDYRAARNPAAPGRLRAQLSRLSLPDEVTQPAAAGAADPVSQLVDRSGLVLPALDIEVADFELRGRKFGSLALQAANRPSPTDPAGRSQWQLTRLLLKNDDAVLSADGAWDLVPGSPRRRMALKFELDVANGGALLERLGFGKVLRGASGRMHGSLGWDGSPLALDFHSLGGRLDMAMKGGQFLQMDPGAARLLGVMSLQSLPRRLALDFRDVFQQGFAFDSATAAVQVKGGLASTENLRLRGLQALVAMEGSADLARETQDLHVVVVPEINASGPALAYAAINPAVGLGAFVGQWLLREPLRLASAREFRITGPWVDPKVERLERGLLDPLPASATARGDAGSAPASAGSAVR